MKANELIKNLQTLVETYGDQEVLVKSHHGQVVDIPSKFYPTTRYRNGNFAYVTDEMNLDRGDVIRNKENEERRKVVYKASTGSGNIYKTKIIDSEDEMSFALHPVSSDLWEIVSRFAPELPRSEPKDVNVFLIQSNR